MDRGEAAEPGALLPDVLVPEQEEQPVFGELSVPGAVVPRGRRGVPVAEVNVSRMRDVAFVWGASAEPSRLAAYRAAAPTAVLSFYMPYSRSPASSEGFDLAFWQAFRPEWVMYQCDRRTVAFWNGETAPHGSVPLDFTNPDVVKWQVANQTARAAQLGPS